MNHQVGALAVVMLGLVGCAQTQTRFQSEDESEKDYAIKTVGDVTSVANAESISVSGIGLVVGLNGTGSVPPGGFRTLLEEQLRKRGVQNVKEILASPNNALVVVSALVPAGARKDDPLDVEITLPPESKTTSLRGGVLKHCVMYNYGTRHSVMPTTQRADALLQGHPLATAEGSVLAGFGDGDQKANLRVGRIWGGGRCRVDRTFFLALNNDQQYARVAMRVADRINATFQASGKDLAEAKTKTVVTLRVPPQYKYNLPRFLRVVRLIPLVESPSATSSYVKRIEQDLLDPARTVTAALRLEALGTGTIPALKEGLASNHVLVRFSAAEALAYLGSSSCGEELGKLVQDQPVLRAYCLTALASLDEAVCHVQLSQLLNSTSAEVRYGAFRALRALDERDTLVRGELVNKSFWLHRVATDSPPLVHISTSRRPEVVLFGDDPYLQAPFWFVVGSDFTITAGKDDSQCTIRCTSTRRKNQLQQCDCKLENVLQTLVHMGGEYPEVVEFLHKANDCKSLTCGVAVDALPQATSVYQIAKAGQEGLEGEPELLRADPEVLNARADFSATPTLFDDGRKPRSRRNAGSRASADAN